MAHRRVTGDIRGCDPAAAGLVQSHRKRHQTSSREPVSIITISAVETEDDVTYSVEDNGVGFDMAYYSKLFGVFQRLQRVEDFEGTGIGLALVRRIVERHHGSVGAEGTVGEGATFFFTLPVMKVEEEKIA